MKAELLVIQSICNPPTAPLLYARDIVVGQVTMKAAALLVIVLLGCSYSATAR